MQTLTPELETLTVDLILAFRAEHLSSGGNVIAHWDKLLSALRVGAHRSADTTQWMTNIRKELRIAAPSALSAKLITELLVAAGPGVQYLEMIEESAVRLMAKARMEADRRRAAKEAEEAEQMAADVEATKRSKN